MKNTRDERFFWNRLLFYAHIIDWLLQFLFNKCGSSYCWFVWISFLMLSRLIKIFFSLISPYFFNKLRVYCINKIIEWRISEKILNLSPDYRTENAERAQIYVKVDKSFLYVSYLLDFIKHHNQLCASLLGSSMPAVSLHAAGKWISFLQTKLKDSPKNTCNERKSKKWEKWF